MKTVLIYDQVGFESIKYAVVDGDWTHFHNVYVNELNSSASSDLCNVLFPDESGEISIDLIEEFPYEEVKNGAKVIVCGFLP